MLGGTAILSAMNSITPHMAGAVDIMVVEQPDGTLKCSPFYGKFTPTPQLLPALPQTWWLHPTCMCDASSCQYFCNRADALDLLAVRFGKYTPMRSKDKVVRILVNGECSRDSGQVLCISGLHASFADYQITQVLVQCSRAVKCDQTS